MARKTAKSKSTPSQATAALALQSKERLDALQKEHQWLLKQIGRKRKELQNFLEKMRSLATEIFGRGSASFQKLTNLDREIHALFAEIFRTRKFGKQTLPKIEGVYRSLQMMGVISPKPEAEAEAEELEESSEADETGEDWQEQERSNTFDSPAPDTSPRPSRNIRQTFVRLAEIFHPDKVTDGETAARHTEIMKEINRAYKEGDFARLLEIERQHQADTSVTVTAGDDMEREYARLAENNQILKDQYEEIKRELRLVRNTPEGEMVKDYRACVREGIDPIEEMLSEADSEVKALEEIRNFVRDFRDKKITIKEFLAGPTSKEGMDLEQMEALLEEMFGMPVTLVRR